MGPDKTISQVQSPEYIVYGALCKPRACSNHLQVLCVIIYLLRRLILYWFAKYLLVMCLRLTSSTIILNTFIWFIDHPFNKLFRKKDLDDPFLKKRLSSPSPKPFVPILPRPSPNPVKHSPKAQLVPRGLGLTLKSYGPPYSRLGHVYSRLGHPPYSRLGHAYSRLGHPPITFLS